MLTCLSWLKLRDITAPPVVLGGIWSTIYVILSLRSGTVEFNDYYYLSFFIGFFFFVVGFFIVVRNLQKNNNDFVADTKKVDIELKGFPLKVAFIIVTVLSLFLLLKVITYTSGNFIINFWQTLSIGRASGTYNEGIIISYARNMIIAFSIISSINYFKNPTKTHKKIFIITFIIALFFCVSAGNRGIIFMLLIATVFSYLFVKDYTNKKKAFIISKLVIIILCIFIFFAFMKYVYEDTSDIYAFIIKQLRVYFSTSTLAFVEWINLPNEYLYGSNTFRFFAEVLNQLGYNVDVSKSVQSYVFVYGDLTNVYTVLHYYASDFGLLYAFFIQILLGVIYGYLYKKILLSRQTDIFYIALLSLLYFPLINQFFDDKYFSILSTWIQLIFWLWLFTSNGFMYKHQNELEKEKIKSM